MLDRDGQTISSLSCAQFLRVFFYNSIDEAVTKAYKGDTILLWDGEHYLLRDFKFFNDSTWDGERNSRIVCYYEGKNCTKRIF